MYKRVMIVLAALGGLLMLLIYKEGSYREELEREFHLEAKATSKKRFLKEVRIGDQIWLAENLDVDKFRNGRFIPRASNTEEWRYALDHQLPAWCYLDFDPVNGTRYGKLYNWYAVCDDCGLAPAGWHIPDSSDWNTLINYLGGDSVAGKIMKDKSGWDIDSTGTNAVGFSGLQGGGMRYEGFSGGFRNYGCWWGIITSSDSSAFTTSAEILPKDGKGHWFFKDARTITAGDDAVGGGNIKLAGLSVRCVKN
jgi:uncharacterized protein (TIGR02145 family)